MKKKLTIKPERFTRSNKITDLYRAQAIFVCEVEGKNINNYQLNKYYKSCREIQLESDGEAPKGSRKHQVVYLKCSITNTEIGFYTKTSFKGWECLRVLFIHKNFRGRGYCSLLVDHYTENSKSISVVEVFKDVQNWSDYYVKRGYKYYLPAMFPSSIALGKLNAKEKFNGIDLKRGNDE